MPEGPPKPGRRVQFMHTFTGKYLAMIVPMVLVLTVMLFAAFELMLYRTAHGTLHDELERTVALHGMVLSEPVWNLNVGRIELILAAVVNEPDIVGAAVFDETGQLLGIKGVGPNGEIAITRTTKPPARKDTFLDTAADLLGVFGLLPSPIHDDLLIKSDILFATEAGTEIIGQVYIAATPAMLLAAARNRMFVNMTLGFVLVFAVVSSALIANRKTFGVPFRLLLASIRSADESIHHDRVEWESNDEIGTVIGAFNEMRKRFETYEDQLRDAKEGLEIEVEKRTADLKASEIRMKAVLDAALDAIVTADHLGRIIEFNPAAEEIFGCSAANAVGKLVDELMIPPNNREIYRQVLTRYLETGESKILGRYIRLDAMRADGAIFPAEMAVTPVRIKDETYFTAHIRDITKRVAAEKRIKHMASHDGLTDIPNRALIRDRLQVAIAGARRDSTKVAVLFADLDDFKDINDAFGHPMGDQVLKEAAKRLLSCVRESDTVGRIGGDEFVLVLADVGDWEDTMTVANKVIDTLKQPFRLKGQDVFIGCCIGIALYPDHGDTADELIHQADAAMYNAKETGKNSCRVVGTG